MTDAYLATGIDTATRIIRTTAPVSMHAAYPWAFVAGGEQINVIGGGGTATLSVEREANGTLPEPHARGTRLVPLSVVIAAGTTPGPALVGEWITCQPYQSVGTWDIRIRRMPGGFQLHVNASGLDLQLYDQGSGYALVESWPDGVDVAWGFSVAAAALDDKWGPRAACVTNNAPYALAIIVPPTAPPAAGVGTKLTDLGVNATMPESPGGVTAVRAPTYSGAGFWK